MDFGKYCFLLVCCPGPVISDEYGFGFRIGKNNVFEDAGRNRIGCQYPMFPTLGLDFDLD